MTYYLECRQLVEQADEVLESGAQRRSFVKWVLVPFSMISGIVLAVAIGCLSKNYLAACLVVAVGAAMSVLSYQAINRMLKRFQNLKGTITLSDTEIILKEGCGKVEKIISYKNIERVEVVPLLGRIELNVPRGNDIYEKMYFICLYTQYSPIQEGEYAFRYDEDERVVMFPYDASAWDILCEHIPQEKRSSLESATPFKDVMWHKVSYCPVNGSMLDGDMPLVTRKVRNGLKK